MSNPTRAARGRPRNLASGTLPVDLYHYAEDPAPRRSPHRRAESLDILDVENLPVIDDWPKEVPISEAEIEVFERWFADVFDEMFGPLGSGGDGSSQGLIKLSSADNNKP